MSRKKKPAPSEVEKLTFRLWAPYTSLVAQKAKQANMSPNQFARFATVAFADSDFMDLQKSLSRIEDKLERLRRDFDEAVSSD